VPSGSKDQEQHVKKEMMKKLIAIYRAGLFVLLTAFIAYPLYFFELTGYEDSQQCFNFSVNHGGRMFFGSNDDMPADKLAGSEATIMIYPRTAASQGYAEFGYFTPEGRL
jgi:hypothetical protein